MKEVSEKVMRNMIFEVLHVERKNLRSKAKTDQRMAEELAKIIVDYAKMSVQQTQGENSMKFQSITMNNFMRYKGQNVIEFSCDEKRNVTVVLGDNTVGKTTIAQAFRERC